MVNPAKYPDSNVFVNLLDLNDPKAFDPVEQVLTSRRAFYFLSHPDVVGILHVDVEFDLAHLKAIHHYLFQDIYAWAGEIRSYPMKIESDIFTPPEKIEHYIKHIANEIKSDEFLIHKDRTFIYTKMARYLGLINMVHPFPDGNGRTQRMFLSQLAQTAAYTLDWSKVHKWENRETAKQAHQYQDFSGLERMIDRILAPI